MLALCLISFLLCILCKIMLEICILHCQVHLHTVELINFRDTISATEHISLAVIYERYALQYVKLVSWKFKFSAKIFYFLLCITSIVSPLHLSLHLYLSLSLSPLSLPSHQTQIKKFFFAFTLRTRCIHYSTFRSHTHEILIICCLP